LVSTEADRDDVALLFSGGVDSTTAALDLARRFSTVHLLTFGNGYGHYKLDRTRHRAGELRRLGAGHFTHSVASVRDLFELLVIDSLRADYRRYRSGFIWCLGCKIAMHTHAILYCLEHGVRVMADGSSGATPEMVEQSPQSLEAFRAFYRGYGIEFTSPVYDQTREEAIRRLEDRGFRMGIRIRDRFLGVQPKCHPGELYYLPFLLLGQAPDHDEDRVADFIRVKCRKADDYIAARCLERGIPRRAGDG